MAKKGKLDAKELEAMRLAEEKRKAEEEKKLLAERRKTEAPDSGAGLPLLINEYCIEQLWDEAHPKPKEFLLEFITRLLTDRGVLDNFEPIDLTMLVEFNLQNLIFAKTVLKFNNRKAAIAVNILWNLLINDNVLYQQKMDIKSQPIEQRVKYFTNKTEQNDLNEFKKLLKNHSVVDPLTGSKYLEASEVKEIVGYAKDVFFTQYNLFKYTQFNQQPKENERLTLFVEIPQEVPPLSQARYIQKENEALKAEEEARKVIWRICALLTHLM